MPLVLVFVFIVVPILELYVLIQIGQAIGILPTIALLILDSVLGAALMRSQGRAAWMRFNRALAEGRIPAREVIDGVLVIFGGALLLTPGFLSDILGLILLLPPTRAVVRRLLVARFGGRLVETAAAGAQNRMGRIFTFQTGGGAGRTRAPRSFDDDVVEGTAHDVPPPRRELP
jgi:UPF0716 protein FxsA